jgi:hypothetical protein
MDWPNSHLKQTFEYLGGERDDKPPYLPFPLTSPLWGIWWGILLVVILVFCGQSSKFIYIDF